MKLFTHRIIQQCEIFRPFFEQQITISSEVFHRSTGTVAEFVAEMQHTAQLAAEQNEAERTQFFTQRLVRQFEALKKATDRLRYRPKATPKFHSGYRFAKNIEQLPAYKQRAEYQKILRALNEKISWLMAQAQQAKSEAEQQEIYQQIQETEYRRQKCSEKIAEFND